MNSNNILDYRPGVGLMLVNKDCKVFLAKRIDFISQAWQMPQGGIDPGETPDEAMFREMLEEIGTDKAEVISKSCKEYFYDFPLDVQDRLWDGQYLGQRQIWYLLKFTGENKDINIKTKTPEFSDWKWFPLNEIVNLVVPFKRKVYQAILEEFMPEIMTNFK